MILIDKKIHNKINDTYQLDRNNNTMRIHYTTKLSYFVFSCHIIKIFKKQEIRCGQQLCYLICGFFRFKNDMLL